MEISGEPVSIGGDMLGSVGVVDYPVCNTRPCRNGGSCRPAASANGFQCFCLEGYSGRNCELIGERCFPGALQMFLMLSH